MPSLSSLGELEKPLNPRSTMKAVIPREAAVESVFAYTISVSASGPFVIHILVPFKTKTPPRLSARNRMLTTSDPASVSLMASAPTCSPLISLGRNFRFCSLVPFFADLVHTQVGVGAVGKSNGRRRARYLLHRHHVLQVSQLRAAVILVHRDAQQPQTRPAAARFAGEIRSCGLPPRQSAQSLPARTRAQCRASARWTRPAQNSALSHRSPGIPASSCGQG